MAAITKRLLRLCPNPNPYIRSYPYAIHRHFSSSSETPPTTPEPEFESESQSSFSSYFKDVKASLQKETPQQNRPQTPRKPFSFSNPTPFESPPSKIASLEEIRRNLSEFRGRSAVPSSGQPVSFQELFKRNVISNTDSSDSPAPKPLGPVEGRKRSYDAIRESIQHLQASAPFPRNNKDSTGKFIDPMSLARFKETLKLKPGETNGDPVIIGGSDSLPVSISEKNKKGKKGSDYKDNAGGAAMRTEFVKMYSFQELGKKLEMLRPEKKKGKWFSLQELNERLVKLREIEDKESVATIGGVTFKDLRESLQNLRLTEETQSRKNTMQRLELLGHLGGTPSFMLSPPKEHLVEKYFHPDHMSSAEKLKLELKKVRDEFKMSESDCGSTRVQVAQLTTKIKHLSTVLQKKDKHSRKGLQEMVQRRKKLLKYLRRTDWDSYCLVLSKLGLRDNPDFKA